MVNGVDVSWFNSPERGREWSEVQNLATCLVTGNYSYETGNMAGVLEDLDLTSLKHKS